MVQDMNQNYDTYSGKNSALCAAEFKDTANMVKWLSFLFAFKPFGIISLLDMIFNFKELIKWQMTVMDGLYFCASQGGDNMKANGFNLADGTWANQKDYLNTQMAMVDAFEMVPYYSYWIILSSGINMGLGLDMIVAPLTMWGN